MQRVEMTPALEKERAKLAAYKWPRTVIGRCQSCGRDIYAGQLVSVTKSQAAPWSTKAMPVQVPAVMYCRKPCKPAMSGSSIAHRQPGEVKQRLGAVPPPPAFKPSMSAEQRKELALRLLKAASKTVAMGSKRLATAAGVPYSDFVLPVLRVLREKKLVVYREGRWLRG